jgi:uncharacterized protein
MPSPDHANPTRFSAAVLLAIAILVAVGFAGGGYLAGRGVIMARLADRFVTVKGVAEIDARANLAIYPITFTITTDDLGAGKTRVDEQIAQARAFFVQRGFAAGDISATRFTVSDRVADGYRAENVNAARYVLTQTLTLRSTDIDLVARTSQDIGELTRTGLALTGFSGPSYIFTADKLNSVKPDLIRRATAAAREAADEFARTSNTIVGSIRNANQGVIAILAPDESANADYGERSSPTKRIRAVTTVEYFLR